MNDIKPNETIYANKNKWVNNILFIANLLPTPLRYVLIFAATALLASAAAYYIDPTGLICGVLAVLIYDKTKH